LSQLHSNVDPLVSAPEKKEEKKAKWVKTAKLFIDGCPMKKEYKNAGFSAETCQARCLANGGNAINVSNRGGSCQCRLCKGTPTPSWGPATGWAGYYVA